jgi:molybdopterin-guanine dinucleotide biosynthesis protein A
VSALRRLSEPQYQERKNPGKTKILSLISSTLEITGAILAGGMSRRLGRDKASLAVQGKPLALWVAAALAPWVSECWLITNQPQVHLSFGLPLLTDLKPGQGPLGGLETALFFAAGPLVLAAAVDAPFLAPPLLEALIARAPRGVKVPVVCGTSRGLQPFPGLYPVSLLPRLGEFLQSGRHVRRFLEQCHPQTLSQEEVARLDPEGRSFFNLNTLEDLERAGAWLARGTPLA